MQWGKHGAGSPSRRRREAFRPSNEPLEDRRLLTTFDLTTTQTAPLGVEMIGKATNNTAGFKVTDVGNVTGSGYDSFVVSAPGLPSAGIGGRPNFASAGQSAAYLVLGSKQVNLNGVANYLTLANGTTNGTTNSLTGGKRAGDLGELGTLGVASQSGTTAPTAQTNPTVAQPQPPVDSTHVYGFNYDGLTLVTGLDALTGLGRNSALGFSVTPLGDLNGDGFDDFAISAPNDAGGGKVFVVFGGTALATQPTTGKTVDLEPTAGINNTATPTKVITLSIPNGTTGTDVGYSVSGIGNYFNTSNGRDVAIGVPGLSVGANANAGAVFALSGTYLSSLASGTNLDLRTVGNGTNSLAGIEYTGAGAGFLTGTSVSTAGSFDNLAGANGRRRDDLLIGAPGAFQGGGAYLVYSFQSYSPNMALGTTQSLTSLGVPAAINPVTYPLQGVVFGDQLAGDRLGFAVSAAGDFNADGAGDIILGAPGYNISAGYADVVFGQTGTTTTRINGIYVLSPTVATTGLKSVAFLGTNAFDYAGYALATTTHISLATTTTAVPKFDVLIGAPGGEKAYLVPGTAFGVAQLTGGQQLSNINTTLGGSLFTVTGLSDPAVLPSGFGTSVSARNPIYDANVLSTTVDGDAIPDLFFGAPFSSLLNPVNLLTTTRNMAGAAYIFESGLKGSTTGGGGGTSPVSGAFTSLAANAFGLLTPVVFTGDNYGLPYPAVSSLEHLNSYAPLPVQIAYNQFLPLPGYRTREEVYHHPGKKGNVHQFPAGTNFNVAAIGHSEAKVLRVHTLSSHIFDRGKTKIGRETTYTHKVKVIPRSQQKGSYPG